MASRFSRVKASIVPIRPPSSVERLEEIVGGDPVGRPPGGDLGPEGVTLMSKPGQPLGDLNAVQGARFDSVEKAFDSPFVVVVHWITTRTRGTLGLSRRGKRG
jgi:hypothetical protein